MPRPLWRTRLWALFDRLAVALLSGAILNAVIMCPPQHGKSKYWSKFFPAWWLRMRPDDRIILGSYAAGYASSWGRETRDVVIANGQLIGSEVRDDVSGASEWKLAGHEGGMTTSGYEGGISGRAAELAIVDDPIKDAMAAASQVEKDKIWTWWQEELSTRLQKGGRRVLLMTRRAVDDPIGRILKLVEAGKENWTVIRLPAIAEEDENWPEWKWQRRAGEALVPELHPIEELRVTEQAGGPHGWAGLYQQRPYPRGGGDLKGEWFKIVAASPDWTTRVRSWDLAASESPKAKETAGVLMTRRRDGNANKYHLADIRHGRWAPGRRNQIILEQAQLDGRDVPIVIEQEGGSGGIAQIEELKRILDGFAVHSAPAARGGSKELRAEALAAQAEIGNVTILEAPWNGQFVVEANSFPAGLIDMIDAASHAYNYLASQDDGIVIPSGYNPEDDIPERSRS